MGKLSKHPPGFLVLITVETSSDLMGGETGTGKTQKRNESKIFPVHLFILIDI